MRAAAAQLQAQKDDDRGIPVTVESRYCCELQRIMKDSTHQVLQRSSDPDAVCPDGAVVRSSLAS